MKYTGPISLSLILAGCLLAAATAPGTASDSDPTPGTHRVLAETDYVTITTDGTWTEFAYKSPLREKELFTYHGDPDADGGCTFTGEETVEVGEYDSGAVTHEREIATNVHECIMKTERGIDDSLDPEDDGTDGSDDWASLDEPGEAEENGQKSLESSLLGTQASASGWHRTYHEDPPGLDVTSAKTRVSWSYNGTCVTASSNQGTNYTWLQVTGWRKDYSETKTSRTCKRARTKSESAFSNQPFCLPIVPTHTKYVPNQISGRPNGAAKMVWSAKKSGDCSSLLSFHRSHN